MPSTIKILIADDSTIMRYMITDLLSQDKDLEIVAQASNGKDAIAKLQQFKPDVVILDLIMGEYSGLYALRHIMKYDPTPTILLSALGNTDMSTVMEGLEIGAIDYVNKPAKKEVSLKSLRSELIQKIKVAAQSNVPVAAVNGTRKLSEAHTFDSDVKYDAVVIGSSTGGPTAIEKVLQRLPKNLAIPVLIAQHMPESFVPSFVKRLDALSPLTVQIGRAGTKLKPRHVYVAPGGKNMVVRRNKDGQAEIGFTQKKYAAYNNPSVNALMESACDAFDGRLIGAILTGMGRDGKDGIQMIFDKGGFTVAQNEESSVVFGMPREAIRSGKVKKVVDLDDIGLVIVSALG